MQLIDGKKIADDIKKEIAAQVEEMVAQGKKRPHLRAKDYRSNRLPQRC